MGGISSYRFIVPQNPLEVLIRAGRAGCGNNFFAIVLTLSSSFFFFFLKKADGETNVGEGGGPATASSVTSSPMTSSPSRIFLNGHPCLKLCPKLEMIITVIKMDTTTQENFVLFCHTIYFK